MGKTSDGHPYLVHDSERLIVAGDSNDRGQWSVPISYFLASSSIHSPENSVVTLMGNHDERIARWANSGFKNGSHGFALTYSQLNDPRFEYQAELLAETVPEYPYWYISKRFIAVHAYWRSPHPTLNEAMRGPTISETVMEGGVTVTYHDRKPWWYTTDRSGDKPIVFGHYHAAMDMLFPEKGLWCVDNHDVGVFTYALDDGEEVKVNVWDDFSDNPLVQGFNNYL